MKTEEKNFELGRQEVLLEYWRHAERVELGSIMFLFGVILLPTILNVEWDFKSWITYIFIAEIIIFGLITRSRMSFYNDKQRKIRETIEKLK